MAERGQCLSQTVGLELGDLRQGALEGIVLEAVAKAAEVPPALVRRALMFGGDLGATAAVAMNSEPIFAPARRSALRRVPNRARR